MKQIHFAGEIEKLRLLAIKPGCGAQRHPAAVFHGHIGLRIVERDEIGLGRFLNSHIRRHLERQIVVIEAGIARIDHVEAFGILVFAAGNPDGQSAVTRVQLWPYADQSDEHQGNGRQNELGPLHKA